MSLRDRVGTVIFGTDTPAGRAFDVALLVAIVASVALVVVESVAGIRARWVQELRVLEWTFTILFTVEYAVRIATARHPGRYVRSFYGVIDLLAILPTYLSLVLAGSHYLAVVRALRLLRVFRVVKAMRYVGQANVLGAALRASREKVIVFLFTVATLVLILGAAMYLIEGPAHGFDDIPTATYWAIVTLTTVGYGDIAPATAAGKALSALVMILGYSIIAVPTGIVTSEITRASAPRVREAHCPTCGVGGHAADATYCRACGAPLDGDPPREEEAT